jgi:hypothetical protein
MTDAPEPQIIPPDKAKTLLREAIARELGDGWTDPDSRWVVVTNTDYMARLSKGKLTVDFYVDYFTGEVTMQRASDAGRETGQIFAWMMLGLIAVIAVVLARGLGYI